jgi:hypothetical protein
MSTILYYSNYCDHSKGILKTLSASTTIQSEIHFICIDKREKDKSGKLYIILENGQKIIMPENINRVPALLLLKNEYKVLYGESIIQYFKPVQQTEVKTATMNNMEPLAFSFNSGGFGDIVSDQYSFLDQKPEDLEAKGSGGTRQMHNYVDLNYSQVISTPADEQDYKSSKIPEGVTVAKLQEQRVSDLSNINNRHVPGAI